MAQILADNAANRRLKQQEKLLENQQRQIQVQQQQVSHAADHAQSVVNTSSGDLWEVYCPRCEKATLSTGNCPCPNCNKPLKLYVVTKGSGEQLWRAVCSLPCTPNATEAESVNCTSCRAKISPQFYRWVKNASGNMSTGMGCLLAMLILPCAWLASFLVGVFISVGYRFLMDQEKASQAGVITTLICMLLGTVLGIYVWIKITQRDSARPLALDKLRYHGFQPPPHWQGS